MARTEICTLATTGGAPTITLAIAAIALLILGIVIVLASRSRSRRGRRGLALGLGTIALMGVVAFAPVLSASPAQAATGAASSACESAQPTTPAAQPAVPAVQPQGPEGQPPTEPHGDGNPVPTLTEVTPEAPVLAEAACGVEPTVVLPETDGVSYSATRVDNAVTVTATAEAGYTFAAGAVTSWTFDVTPAACQCVPNEVNWGADATGFTYNVPGGRVTGLPSGWAQSLADQGASFAVSFENSDVVTGFWQVANGELPADVDHGTVQFTGSATTSGANGTTTPAGDLQFTNSNSGESAFTVASRAQADLQAQYPDLGISFAISDYSYVPTTTLTVSVVNSCGTVVTREYLGVSSGNGGGGNN